MRTRKLIVAVIVASALFAMPVLHAVDVTLVFTSAQVAVATWKYSSQGGAVGTGFATLSLWFADQVNRLITEWASQKAQADKLAFCVSFNAASTANKNSSCTAIGQPTGCDPCQN